MERDIGREIEGVERKRNWETEERMERGMGERGGDGERQRERDRVTGEEEGLGVRER